MNQLAERVAIVTGASSGIGRAIAEAYAAEGATVVLAARSADKLDEVAAAIGKTGGTAIPVRTDVTREAEVIALFRRVMADHGRLDILVNNAGGNVKSTTHELSLADWQRIIDLNLTAAFLCSREALKVMIPQKGGRIINIGSVSAKMPRVHSAAYTTSKFGLEGLTRSLALDGREHGIAVSILQPGNTATAIWEGRADQGRKEGIMQSEDVARVALLMATLPEGVSLLEGVILPFSMPFLGRG